MVGSIHRSAVVELSSIRPVRLQLCDAADGGPDPAWREVYTRIMDELATRHTTYWAAIDWNTFIGPSPDRQNYPDGLMQQWPERVRGNYDAPGWTANGVEPWGLEPDPIGAAGATCSSAAG